MNRIVFLRSGIIAFLLCLSVWGCKKTDDLADLDDGRGLSRELLDSIRHGMTLYDKPVDVIQSIIRGKWRVYEVYFGAHSVDKSYPKNRFRQFAGTQEIYEDDGSDIIQPCLWKQVTFSVNNNNVDTYLLWIEGTDEKTERGTLFYSINLDTLRCVFVSPILSNLWQYPAMEEILVREKNGKFKID